MQGTVYVAMYTCTAVTDVYGIVVWPKTLPPLTLPCLYIAPCTAPCIYIARHTAHRISCATSPKIASYSRAACAVRYLTWHLRLRLAVHISAHFFAHIYIHMLFAT